MRFIPAVFALSAFTLAACASNSGTGSDHAAVSEEATSETELACRKTVVPSNLPANLCDTQAASDLTLEEDMDPTKCDAVVVQGSGAPEICVRMGRNVSIKRFTPSFNAPYLKRAYAVVATNDLTVDGPLDAGSTRVFEYYEDGPGGGDPRGSGGDAGGAGHATAGGGSNGGPSYGNETAIPLVGGARGGGYTLPETSGGQGGGGGGAVQLVACHQLTVTANATINAGGGAGMRGSFAFPPNLAGGPGGGGGSGGTILLEAPQMSIRGGIAANGGGGGGGGGSSHYIYGDCAGGGDGSPGTVTTSPAQGGPRADGGGGGQGGTATSPPAAGTEQTCESPRMAGSGGGGGAVGRIRLNVRAGTQPDIAGAVFSPAPSIGAVATH